MDVRLYHDSHNRLFRSFFGARPTGSALRLALEITGIPEEDLANCTVTLRLWHSQKGEFLQPMDFHGTWATIDLTMPDEPAYCGIISKLPSVILHCTTAIIRNT